MIKTFPEFSKLTLEDREEYEGLIKDYPPLSDLSFVSLMLWWNNLGGLAVSRLNGNLVISYWIPGDEAHSGLSLIGHEQVDESVCTIFDYLIEKGEHPRLTNVPEFVVNSMRYPELFAFRSGRGDDEYLISVQKFAIADSMPAYMRVRANKFKRGHGEENIEVKELNLHSARVRQLMLDSAAEWPKKGINNINKLEREMLPKNILRGPALGARVVGLYINGNLEGYAMYFLTKDPEYAVVGHARVNYDFPRIFDYMVHAFCAHFASKGVKFMNIDADNGSMKMRALKIALKPENFFRKYSVEPARSVPPVTT